MFRVCDIEIQKLLEDTKIQGRIYGVSDAEAPESHSIVFVKNQLADSYREVRESIFITREDMELCLDGTCVHLKSPSPKNVFGELLEKIKSLAPKVEQKFVDGSFVGADLQMGEDVKIGPFCVIGKDVVIGSRSEIRAGTVIGDHVRIGSDVQIREHCIIGVDDADIYRPENGACRTLPHLAGTVIEDGCLLLAGAVLAAGDTRTTVLGRGSMIGLVGDVGHNCLVGEAALVGGKASVSGHCQIEDHVYIAPMSVTMNRITVASHAYLGLGAVAINDVPEGEKQFGNPARKVLERGKK